MSLIQIAYSSVHIIQCTLWHVYVLWPVIYILVHTCTRQVWWGSQCAMHTSFLHYELIGVDLGQLLVQFMSFQNVVDPVSMGWTHPEELH